MTEDDDDTLCEHEWETVCDGVEHTDTCTLCGTSVVSPCTEAGTWPDDDEVVD